jgi:hypothetical protein
MSALKASRGQIGMIHALSKQAGFDDDVRRDVIERATGKRSTKDLSAAEAIMVIDRIKVSVHGASALRLDGAYARVLKALWLTAWNCGLVRRREDQALIAFIERQTGLSHPRFLIDGADARKAIEALKRWIARDAGVIWPSTQAPARDRKIAVLEAQHRIRTALFAEAGRPAPAEKAYELYTDVELDQLQAQFGFSIRAAKERQITP